jgi:hypothetical protein
MAKRTPSKPPEFPLDVPVAEVRWLLSQAETHCDSLTAYQCRRLLETGGAAAWLGEPYARANIRIADESVGVCLDTDQIGIVLTAGVSDYLAQAADSIETQGNDTTWKGAKGLSGEKRWKITIRGIAGR